LRARNELIQDGVRDAPELRGAQVVTYQLRMFFFVARIHFSDAHSPWIIFVYTHNDLTEL